MDLVLLHWEISRKAETIYVCIALGCVDLSDFAFLDFSFLAYLVFIAFYPGSACFMYMDWGWLPYDYSLLSLPPVPWQMGLVCCEKILGWMRS